MRMLRCKEFINVHINLQRFNGSDCGTVQGISIALGQTVSGNTTQGSLVHLCSHLSQKLSFTSISQLELLTPTLELFHTRIRDCLFKDASR